MKACRQVIVCWVEGPGDHREKPARCGDPGRREMGMMQTGRAADEETAAGRSLGRGRHPGPWPEAGASVNSCAGSRGIACGVVRIV